MVTDFLTLTGRRGAGRGTAGRGGPVRFPLEALGFRIEETRGELWERRTAAGRRSRDSGKTRSGPGAGAGGRESRPARSSAAAM